MRCWETWTQNTNLIHQLFCRYDSEYDNYSRAGHYTSDAESDFPNEDIDSDVGAVLDELSLENIRQISKNITKKFGAKSDREEEDSDAV